MFLCRAEFQRRNWKNDAIFMMLSLMKIKTGNQKANAEPNWACGLYAGTRSSVDGYQDAGIYSGVRNTRDFLLNFQDFLTQIEKILC